MLLVNAFLLAFVVELALLNFLLLSFYRLTIIVVTLGDDVFLIFKSLDDISMSKSFEQSVFVSEVSHQLRLLGIDHFDGHPMTLLSVAVDGGVGSLTDDFEFSFVHV